MLQMIHLAYWGIIFYAAGWLLLIWIINHNKKTRNSIDWIGLLGITGSYFTLTTDFPWLLVVYEYFYYFLAIGLLIIYDRYLMGVASLYEVFIATFLGAIFLDSFGVVAILSGILVMLASYKNENKNKLFVAIPLVVLTYGLAWILLRAILGEGMSIASTSRLTVLHALLSRPVDILQSLLITFSQPIADKAILFHYFPEIYRPIQSFIGFIGLVFVVIIATSYWRAIGPKQSLLPLLLILFGVVAWVLIVLTRYLDFGIAIFDSQRFTRFFTLYYVGAGAAIYLGSFRPAVGTIYSVVFVFIFTVTAVFQFKNMEHVNRYFENAAIALKRHIRGDHVIEKYIGQCANSYCDSTIEFLRKNDIPMISRN